MSLINSEIDRITWYNVMQSVSSFLILPLPLPGFLPWVFSCTYFLTFPSLPSWFTLFFFFHFCLMLCTVRMFKCFRSSENNKWFFSSVQFSRLVMSDSLWPYELGHARPPCPSPTPRACWNSYPLSWRWHQPFHPLSSLSPPAFTLS